MRGSIRSALGTAAAVALAALGPAAVEAQVIQKKVVRAFNNCDYPEPYVFDYSFFTADGSETTLTYSRSHIACSVRCQDIPIYPSNSCNQLCYWNDRTCSFGWVCSACTRPGCIGPCVAGVDLTVGHVMALKASRFCAIAACTGTIPLGCPPSSACDGSGTCSDAVSNAKGLCLCPDPACPIGQRLCGSAPVPTIPAADLIYNSASAGASAWLTGYATPAGSGFSMNGIATPTSLSQVRLPTVPGEEYVVVTLWSTYPIVNGFTSCPDAALMISIDSRPDSCGP